MHHAGICPRCPRYELAHFSTEHRHGESARPPAQPLRLPYIVFILSSAPFLHLTPGATFISLLTEAPLLPRSPDAGLVQCVCSRLAGLLPSASDVTRPRPPLDRVAPAGRGDTLDSPPSPPDCEDADPPAVSAACSSRRDGGGLFHAGDTARRAGGGPAGCRQLQGRRPSSPPRVLAPREPPPRGQGSWG